MWVPEKELEAPVFLTSDRWCPKQIEDGTAPELFQESVLSPALNFLFAVRCRSAGTYMSHAPHYHMHAVAEQ